MCVTVSRAGIPQIARETGDRRRERGPARGRRRAARALADRGGRRMNGSAPPPAGKHERGTTAVEICVGIPQEAGVTILVRAAAPPPPEADGRPRRRRLAAADRRHARGPRLRRERLRRRPALRRLPRRRAVRGAPAAAGAPRAVPPVQKVPRGRREAWHDDRSSGPPAGRTTRTRSRSGSPSRSRASTACSPRTRGRCSPATRRSCTPGRASRSATSRTSASGRVLLGASRAGLGFVLDGEACPVEAAAFMVPRDHLAGALRPPRRPGRGPGAEVPDAVLLPRLRSRTVRAARDRRR